MADVKFTVEGKGKNLKKTAKEADDLGKATERAGKGFDGAGKAQDRYHRGAKGAAGATSNSTKALSSVIVQVCFVRNTFIASVISSANVSTLSV